MKIIPLDSEQRKIFINSCQVYQTFIAELKVAQQFSGGMHWKKSGNREYLFKSRGGRGQAQSLGCRSSETEAIYMQFHKGKKLSKERINSLKESVTRQSKLAVAVGINRMPKTAAKIIRLLDQEGILGKGIAILGTHALYAYEAAAGVMIASDLLATQDIDFLYNTQYKLKLSSELEMSGLIGLLKKTDKTFELISAGSYRAVNSKGFMVDLIKNIPEPAFKTEKLTLSRCQNDLQAVEIDGLKWLNSAPDFRKTVMGGDGIPVDMVVPDPRHFALHKFWLSQRADRDPVKRPRDFQQSKVVAEIAINYLNLNIDQESMQVFPEFIRNQIPRLIEDAVLNQKSESDLDELVSFL